MSLEAIEPSASIMPSSVPTDQPQMNPKPNTDMVYCNPLALGRDLAHIIITCPLSDIYICSPLCLLVATLCPSSPHDICGPSGPPHTNLLSGWSFCQDSTHFGASSGLDVLIRKWVPLRDHWQDSTWCYA